MGLANRLVPQGRGPRARDRAGEGASRRFPQNCLRADRLSRAAAMGSRGGRRHRQRNARRARGHRLGRNAIRRDALCLSAGRHGTFGGTQTTVTTWWLRLTREGRCELPPGLQCSTRRPLRLLARGYRDPIASWFSVRMQPDDTAFPIASRLRWCHGCGTAYPCHFEEIKRAERQSGFLAPPSMHLWPMADSGQVRAGSCPASASSRGHGFLA
mgnify:CR=1 FL=1